MKNKVLTCLLAALLAFAGPTSLAFAQNPPAPAAASPAGKGRWGNVFVIKRNAAGESVCVPATPTERAQIIGRQRSGEAVEIYSGGRLAQEVGKDGRVGPDMLTSTGQVLEASAGLRIVLHATPRLAQNAIVSDAFRAAANRWEATIATPITVVLDVDYGPDFFGDPDQPFDEDTIGATGSAEFTARYPVVRQRLLANSPEAAETALYNNLPTDPTFSVPVEFNGKTSGAGYVKLTAAVGRALGLEPDITNPETVPLFGGDAGIGFNSQKDFDFNPSDGIGNDLLDFDATAVHEIGHALGFVSESGDDTDISLSPLDLFRIRPGTAIASNLTTVATARRVMSLGGTQVFFSNRLNTFGTNELGLSTGGPTGSGGDGRQSSHWKDNAGIGLMDPTLSPRVRGTLSANDRLAFDTFGYKLAPAAAPAPPAQPAAQPPANNNFNSAFILPGSRGWVVGDNLDATAQAGEPDPVHDPDGVIGQRSVWFFWTAPASGTATFETVGSNYDTTLGAYVGGAHNTLTPAPGQLPENDDIDPGIVTDSRIIFNATAGTTYRIMVNGWHSANGAFKLRWTSTLAPAESVFEFSQDTYTAPEHDRAVGITIKRTGNVAAPATVALSAYGSASALSGLGPVTFAAGETFKSVPVTILDDLSVEPDHSIGLALSPASPGGGVVVGARDRATLTVADDDTFPANIAQFSGAATRTVAEGAGRIDLTVTRSGTLTRDAFVDYRTSDGTALATRDYLFAGGTLHFLAGEATKTISVLITEDSFNDEGETFQITLSNPLRANLPTGPGAAVTVQIQDDDPAGLTTNPNDRTADFVEQHYNDFLNRVPDAGGLQFWSEGIENCGANAQCRRVKRVDTSAAFFLSIEFQETGFLAYRMYKAAFGDIDPPEVPVPVRFEEFMRDTQELGRGLVVGVPGWPDKLEANKDAFARAFISRGRFKAAFPAELTPAQFVDTLNRNAGNVLTAQQRENLVISLTNSTDKAAAQAEALRTVADNQLLRDREFRKAFVLMQYFGYMRRDPDGGQDAPFGFAGFNFWLGKLNEFNGDFRRAEMVRAFIESIEYRQRFGQ